MWQNYRITTLGCKVNQYESQQLREVLESLGLRPAGRHESPHVAVVNTCAVTTTALSKSRQAVRKLARDGRTAVFVVGCGASADAERLRRINGVKAVLGHSVDICQELRSLLAPRLEGLASHHPGGAALKGGAIMEHLQADRYEQGWMSPGASAPGKQAEAGKPTATPFQIIPPPEAHVKQDGQLVARIEAFEGRQRAFLKVQDGCDAHCTYCIIPQLRPALKSKPIRDAVREVEGLVRNGHKEVIVTGIFLGAFGRPTAIRKRFGSGPSPLAELVDALAQVEGLQRLRLSSLEPGDVDETLLEVLARHDCCVPHLHLPLQSGSPEILRRMNRQYTREQYLEMVDAVRLALDRPAITTDIIAGFPGETEADFEASLQVARYAKFGKIHAFPFSPRPGTAAAKWQREMLPSEVIRARMGRLREVERECSTRYRRGLVGEVERVIVEETPGVDEFSESCHDMHYGRTDRYFPVFFEAEDVRIGDLVSVRIDRVTPTRTHGTLLRPGSGSYPLTVLAKTP